LFIYHPCTVQLLVIDNRGKEVVVGTGFKPLINIIKRTTGAGPVSAADRSSAMVALRTLHACVPHPAAKADLARLDGMAVLEAAGRGGGGDVASLALAVLSAYRSPPGAP
jgi:hypothetical protein